QKTSRKGALAGPPVPYRFPVGEAPDNRPVFFKARRLRSCGHKGDFAAQLAGEDPVCIASVALKKASPGQSHSYRRRFLTARRLNESSLEIKKLVPLPRVLGTGNLAIRFVYDCKSAVPDEAAVRYFRGGQFPAHHRLDGVS